MDTLLALCYQLFKFSPFARSFLVSIRVMFQLSKLGIRVNDLSKEEHLQIINLSKAASNQDPPMNLTLLYISIFSLLKNSDRSIFRIAVNQGLLKAFNFVEMNKEEQGLGVEMLEEIAQHELSLLERSALSQTEKTFNQESLDSFSLLVKNLRINIEMTIGPITASKVKVELSEKLVKDLLKK